MNPAIRIGIVGAGVMGRQHAKLVADSSTAVTVGFSDPDSSAALDPVFAKAKYYRDHLKLIQVEAPDGIIIGRRPTLDRGRSVSSSLAIPLPDITE